MRWIGSMALAFVAGLPSAAASQPGAATAHRGRLVVEREVLGWIEPARRQTLDAPDLPDLPSWIVTQLVEPGSSVGRDQTVIELDPAEAGWLLRQAEGRLEQARARKRVSQARLALERLERQAQIERAALAIERAELKAQEGVGLTPRLAVEKAALDRKAAALSLGQARQALTALEARAAGLLAEDDLAVTWAEAAVAQARRAVEAARLVARMDGRVRLAPDLAPGVVVRAGQPLAEVLGTRRLRARFLIDADPARPFKPVGPISLELPASGGKRMAAKIVVIRLARPALGARPARLELVATPEGSGPAPGLLPGEPVSLWLKLVLTEQALLVPAQAVVHTPGGPVVWCLEAPAGYRAVTLGDRTPELAQIRSGLVEGERVSLDPRASARAAAPEGVGEGGSGPQEASP